MCERVKLPDGNVAIVCGRHGRRHYCACGAIATAQCDWKLGDANQVTHRKTCDAWICTSCAQEVGPDKHLCPAHQVAYIEWKARRAARKTQSSVLSPQSSAKP